MITFENSPVQIGDFTVLANSASISIQTPVKGTTRFGSPGFYSQIRDGRSVGSLSVSYYMTEGDTGVRSLFTGSGIQLFDISVGPYRCYSGVANSMSMTIEPYSVVSCTLDVSFYNGYDQGGSTSNIDTPADVIHGGNSEASTDLLWGGDIISANYSMNHSISPVYALGELTPSGYTRDGGTIEVALEGTGWGHVIDTSTLCEGYTTGNISLRGLCCIDEIQHLAGDIAGGWVTYTDGGYQKIDGSTLAEAGGAKGTACWEVGNNVTITWPGGAGSPWSDGISAEIYALDRGSSSANGAVFYRFSASLGVPPTAYAITVSNDTVALGGSIPPPYTIPFSGYVTNPSIAVEPNSEIVGSLTVFGSF